MRVEIIVAGLALALTVPVAAQVRGSVNGIVAQPAAAGAATQFTVRGTNPCNSIRVEYGDGTGETHQIGSLPARVSHAYPRAGSYNVTVRGAGNCAGAAAVALQVKPAGSAPGANMRFQGMDTNGDGRITRSEWRGSAQSFDVHDWNNDGVLSGEEVRAGGTRQWPDDPDFAANRYVLDDWSPRRFQQLDRNADGRLTQPEWSFDMEAFYRADRNRDGALSRAEFLTPTVDDDRGDQFDYLDANGNGRVERSEWHASPEAFTWLDRNRDGVLTRLEAAGNLNDTGDTFARLDLNNDRAVSVAEWQWSRRSFDQLDTNRDGRLTRSEFNAAGPIGTTGSSTPISVRASNRWTDTGIYVQAGDVLTFSAQGTIGLSADGSDVADPPGARSGRRAPNAPLRNEPAGALIGRIGNSPPLMIGGQSEIRAPRSGRLYLGVNDDELSDNNAEFRVVVTHRPTLVQGQ